MTLKTGTWRISILAAALSLALSVPAGARDAAFMDPGSSSAGAEQPIKIEPKEEVDTGESVLNVAKRTALFFVNQTSQPIKIEKVAANSDGDVTAEITNDDCSKQGILQPLSRCSIEVSVTPTSPGPWNVDILMTHNGPGRLTRAKLTGKTSGTASGDKKDTGLALSTKEISPVNFGDVDVGSGKAVRSALMINDSPDPITLYSIDVIEAENGLQRLDQGCAVDMELKSGESCPVTLVWTPTERGQISTDLIIRHSGRLGFAVIPIRGATKGGEEGKSVSASSGTPKGFPAPPSATDLEKATTAAIAPVSLKSLDAAATTTTSGSGALRLIGTVGNRAVLLVPDGSTVVANVGEEFDMGDKKAKVTAIGSKSADIVVDGKKRTLTLGAAPELTAKAMSLNKEKLTNSVTGSGDGSQSLFGPSSGSFSASSANIAPVTSVSPTNSAAIVSSPSLSNIPVPSMSSGGSR